MEPEALVTQQSDVVPCRSANSSAKRSGLVHAFAWTGVATWAVQLVTWSSTIIVARFLAPSDYGLIGMANIYMGLAALVSEFGLGATVVAMRELTEDQVAQLNTVSVVLGMFLFLSSCGVAPFLARFFGVPQLQAVTTVMGVTFMVTAFKVIPDAILQKGMRFRSLAHIQVVQSAVTAIVTMIAAGLGAGYWCLVLGGVLGSTSGSVLTLFYSHHRFSCPKSESIRESLALSWNLVVSRVAWYSYSNSDFLVAGRVLGQAALGSYTLAWNIASLPIQKITTLVTRVMPSYFAAAQTNMLVLRQYILLLTEGLLLLTLPASLGMCIIADQAVHVLLGAKWAAASVPLAILAVYIAVRSVTTIYAPLLVATGKAPVVTWTNVAAAVYFPIGFYLGSHWGTAGIAAVWPALYWIVILPLYRSVARLLSLSLRDYIAVITPAVRSAFVMVCCVVCVRTALSPRVSMATCMVCEIAVGVIAYSFTTIMFDRERLHHLYRIARPVEG